MKIATGDVKVTQPGQYQVVYESAGGLGTGLIEISKDDGVTWQDMTGQSFTTSEDKVFYTGGCKLRFTLTGDAQMWMDRLP